MRPQGVTSQGKEISNLYTITFIVGAAIFLFVEGLIVFAVVRYRRRPTDTALPVQTHGNNALEIIWTIIPTAIVGVLFILSWSTLNNVDKVSAGGDIRIRAVAQRFQWSFEYLSPDGQTVLFQQLAPEMTVPAGQVVHLSLRSTDVIHAFYVPQFLFKRDVVPGKENDFDFTVDAADAGQTFHGQCAELCGTFHDKMEFSVVGDDARRLPDLASAADRGRRRDACPAAVGRPAAIGWRLGRPTLGPGGRRSRSVRDEHRLRREDPHGAGQHPDHPEVHEQRCRDARTTSCFMQVPTNPTRCCSTARSSPASTPSSTRSRRSSPAPTHSCARCIRR